MNILSKIISSSDLKYRTLITRNLHSSILCFNRRPPGFKSRLNKKFPFLDVYYDNDSEGPYDVIVDRLTKYPPGNWGSYPIENAWKKHKMIEKYRKIGTLEEKFRELSWDEFNLFYHDIKLPILLPETLEFSQYITRTKVINQVPDSVKDSFSNVSIDDIKDVSNMLLQKINLQFEKITNFIPDYDEKANNQYYNELICQLMNTVVRNNYSNDFFENYTTGEVAEIETFFKRCGYDHLNITENVRDHDGFIKYKLKGELAWNIRSRSPLKPFVELNDPLFEEKPLFPNYNHHPKNFDLIPEDNLEFTCHPKYNVSYSPKVNLLRNRAGYMTNTIFKIGDPCEFSILGVINAHRSRALLEEYKESRLPIIERHMLSDALLHGFTWCVAQAQNQGFMWHDSLSYPFCCSLVITDGTMGQMVYYQLNSMDGLWKPEDANLPVNLMFCGPIMPIFTMDATGNQVTEINSAFIHQLLSAIRLPVMNYNTKDLQPNLNSNKASRDLKEFMLPFDSSKATTRELQKYPEIGEWPRLIPKRWNKSHPNRVYYLEPVESYELQEEFRTDIVPGADKLSPWARQQITQEWRQRRNHRRGKLRALPDPPPYK